MPEDNFDFHADTDTMSLLILVFALGSTVYCGGKLLLYGFNLVKQAVEYLLQSV